MAYFRVLQHCADSHACRLFDALRPYNLRNARVYDGRMLKKSLRSSLCLSGKSLIDFCDLRNNIRVCHDLDLNVVPNFKQNVDVWSIYPGCEKHA